ncbi:rCG22442 [Rattus norvegicus]|uniref:RCG22442 n=1 Tax=Rattus norvegicus TaxID=10116 RepID=A6IP73_RAT|nr:rCG22442 [Rattus norvegicus]
MTVTEVTNHFLIVFGASSVEGKSHPDSEPGQRLVAGGLQVYVGYVQVQQ